LLAKEAMWIFHQLANNCQPQVLHGVSMLHYLELELLAFRGITFLLKLYLSSALMLVIKW